jgi:hypothetical protein
VEVATEVVEVELEKDAVEVAEVGNDEVINYIFIKFFENIFITFFLRWKCWKWILFLGRWIQRLFRWRFRWFIFRSAHGSGGGGGGTGREWFCR